MKRKALILLLTAAVLAAAVFVVTNLNQKPDIKARVISVNELEAAQGETETLIVVNGAEFGHEDKDVYLKITSETVIENSSGYYFPANSLLKDDIVEVYYADSSNNVITVKKIVLLYYDNK